MIEKTSSLTTSKRNWLWKWAEPERSLTVIPKSKTKRLAQQAKLANVDAEIAFVRAYKMEIERAKAVGEAMYKSGKALKLSSKSLFRQFFLRSVAARRLLEPGYRKKSNS